MKLRFRAALVLAGALVALAFAGTALAAYTPKLAVSQSKMALSSTGATTLHISIPGTDDPTAKITIFAPTGTTANLTAATGSTIGQATASVIALDTPGPLTLPLEGPVTVDNPANHTADVCAPGTHAAVWLLALSVAGQPVTIPVYVDPTSGAETAFGSFKIQVCLPPPDVPQGTPGRSAQGAKLIDTKFSVSVFTTPGPPAQLFRWEGIFTPYVPGRGVPNVAGTVEARAIVGLPPKVTLSVVFVKRTNTFQLKGRVSEGDAGTAGATAEIFRGPSPSSLKKVSATTTKANGAFSTAGHLKPRKTTFFQVRTTVAERDFTSQGCVSPVPAVAPGGCVSATLAPWSARSAVVGIRLR